MTDNQLAEIIWDYMKMNIPLKQVDAIIVLGSHDLNVPLVAAEVFKQGLAPLIVCTGGLGTITENLQTESEAQKFFQIISGQGVAPNFVLVETQSKNTGENFMYTKNLLESKNIMLKSAIVISKPYMERRAYATGKKVWPELEIVPYSQEVDFEEYLANSKLGIKMIDVLVGDLQRIDQYGKKGFQIPQFIPEEVNFAFKELVKRGYNSRLI